MAVKVCIITTVHSSLDTRIFYKQAKSLFFAGYKVILIAQQEKDVVTNGIEVLALPKVKNRMFRMLCLNWLALITAIKQKADIYHFHDPEFIPYALILSFVKKIVIYDVHEDVPKQIFSKHWIWKPIRLVVATIVDNVEKLAYKHFASIIVATPAIAERFSNSKIVVLNNFPILEEYLLASSPLDYKVRKNNVVYIGSISKARGIIEIIRAVDKVPSAYSCRLLLGGQFESDRLYNKITNETGWGKVKYYGFLSRTEVVNTIGASKVGLVIFRPEPNHLHSQPNKLFEYMAAGIPVIASNFSLWKEIVEGSKCGITVDPMDPVAIANAIIFLLERPIEANEMGLRGKRAVMHKYNWNNEEKKLLLLYSQLSNKLGN